MAPMNGLTIFRECEKRRYKDPKIGDLVNSLYKVIDHYKVLNETFLPNVTKKMYTEEVVDLFRRLHRERGLDDIDYLLDFIFNHAEMTFFNLMRILKAIYFVNEVSVEDFKSTIRLLRENKVIDSDKMFDLKDNVFLKIVGEMNVCIQKYDEMLEEKFKDNWDVYTQDDSQEHMFFLGQTAYVADFIYRNGIDLSVVRGIYDYLLDNIYDMNVYYELNRISDNTQLCDNLKYSITTNMIFNYLNSIKTNTEITIH